jgi:hypothetical protein
VFLKDSLQANTEANIFSYLWLKSDIIGEIENANYYFENDNKETNQALDNLLLTQGFRKFKEENISKEAPPLLKYKPEYQQHIITGKITYKNSSNKPAADILTTFSVLGNTSNLYGAKSDAEGNLSFYTKDIIGPVQLALQTNSLADSIYKIELNSPFVNWKIDSNFTSLKLSKSDNTSILNRSVNMQVQNVYHTDSLKKFLNQVQLNTKFYRNTSDKNYKLDQYVRFPTLEEVLREYVPEVVVKKRESNFSLGIYNVQDKIYLDNTPLVLLDGVPIKDPNKLINYNPLKLKEMDIVAKKYYLGPLVFGGILNFTSNKGNFKDFDLDPNILVDYDGLQLQREFYSPIYESPNDKKSRLPDFRTLLYWNAEVKTSLTGEKKLNFYTSDLKGNYTIVLQGLSDNGRVGYTTASFKVD